MENWISALWHQVDLDWFFIPPQLTRQGSGWKDFGAVVINKHWIHSDQNATNDNLAQTPHKGGHNSNI